MTSCFCDRAMKKLKKDSLKSSMQKLALSAKEASSALAALSGDRKNEILLRMADALIQAQDAILKANLKDLSFAKKKGLSGAFLERLTLSQKRIGEMAESMRQIASLEDPVSKVISSWDRPNGLKISKVRVPIGVIMMIYESRPNVTSDCVGLCFKSGNVAILRGGSDAFNSNLAIFDALERVWLEAGLPRSVANLVRTTDRKAVDVLLSLDKHIDLVMPRGGESLIKEVADKSRIPVIKHYKGVCHVFVDASADFAMAQAIILNAKVQRPSVCNAIETLLVHEAIAKDFLPTMIEALQDAGVEIRGDVMTRKLVRGLKAATEEDWYAEYLDLILAVKVVKNLSEAIEHINAYGSNHSDSIVTEDSGNAEEFLNRVDSACVYVNASTRFTDGGQFGFGSEIGISTDKLHARGPMGLEELTTYKYMVRGTGQVRG